MDPMNPCHRAECATPPNRATVPPLRGWHGCGTPYRHGSPTERTAAEVLSLLRQMRNLLLLIDQRLRRITGREDGQPTQRRMK